MSTKDDVQRRLGPAQQYLGPDTWMYICQEINGSTVVHNEITTFRFDGSGRLERIDAIRQGAGSVPPPDCIRN